MNHTLQENSPPGAVILVSLMPGDGGTGVETHIRHLIESLGSQAVPVHVVTPYSGRFCSQRVANFVANLFMQSQPEAAWLWLRRVYVRLLTAKLSRLVRRLENPASIVFSAQDALSALVALQVRDAHAPQARVVLTAHFNVSEAEEFVGKGIASDRGELFQALLGAENEAMAKVDRLIFVSEFSKLKCQARVPELASSLVVPNFVPEPKRRSVNVRAADAIAIGSLEARKNQQFLLRVFAQCKKRGYCYNLTLAGQGEDLDGLKQLADELKISEQVSFLGHVPDAQTLIPEHRVLLHAAKMESFGIVVVESMAHGVPVIAARVGGVTELFDDDEGGYFWNLDCVATAAEKLIYLLETEGKVESMGARARLNFETNFDPERLASRWHRALLTV